MIRNSFEIWETLNFAFVQKEKNSIIIHINLKQIIIFK